MTSHSSTVSLRGRIWRSLDLSLFMYVVAYGRVYETPLYFFALVYVFTYGFHDLLQGYLCIHVSNDATAMSYVRSRSIPKVYGLPTG